MPRKPKPPLEHPQPVNIGAEIAKAGKTLRRLFPDFGALRTLKPLPLVDPRLREWAAQLSGRPPKWLREYREQHRKRQQGADKPAPRKKLRKNIPHRDEAIEQTLNELGMSRSHGDRAKQIRKFEEILKRKYCVRLGDRVSTKTIGRWFHDAELARRTRAVRT
jgi:hypothetical protein